MDTEIFCHISTDGDQAHRPAARLYAGKLIGGQHYNASNIFPWPLSLENYRNFEAMAQTAFARVEKQLNNPGRASRESMQSGAQPAIPAPAT